ncbi:hypothetical protein GGR21_001165 [Dysgonomonas hofstadii]|uniref:DUF5077 domain-containing protein n=1 Tax=Dysgonomonas hofstadii TaxID=637886 RepID=A0A840CIW6_9BACT|nr:DUF3472 domain-containing protein [Dysgonomonas hofstadii]MBB4035276.1 hypothetical protein [Dysgonomonas hofstadii]
MKQLFFAFFCFLLSFGSTAQTVALSDDNIVSIPLTGNTYITSGQRIPDIIGENGITAWDKPEIVFSLWFKLSNPGELNVALRTKNEAKDNSKVKVSVAGMTNEINISGETWSVVPAGKVKIEKAGYVRVDIQGLEKSGKSFGSISEVIVSGTSAKEPVYFVRNFSHYWGRRGPSVHMKYELPKETDIEYFYNEVTVPEGNDVIGSYFMSNGFSGGYFGMQVNKETERRVLFSVWSPYETHNPKEIPEEYQIKTLARGEDVHIGEFGNEGSGGQSYLKYMWKAGVTYKFLTRIRPDGKGNTIFTSYFFATDENRWRLIASFLRPKTDTWYKGAHSFLENFSPDQGFITRKVYFGNQWAVTTKGKWISLTQGRFTYDATAGAGVRQDYKGGMEDNRFFLQNCGFFDENTILRATFERTANEKDRPKINLKKLPTK